MVEKTHVIIAVGAASLTTMIVVGIFFRHKLKHLNKYGYLGIFLFCLIGNIAMFSPAAPMITLISGRYYTAWLVGLTAALGAILGEVLAYNVGAVGQLAIKDEPWFETVHQYMEKNGFLTILMVTAVPNPVFNFAGGAAGFLHYPMWKFLIASFLGNWMQYTITAGLGSLTKKII